MIIRRPPSVHPGVNSEEEYKQFARIQLARSGRAGQELIESQEWPMAFISDDRWVVECVCGGGCSASPEWDVAICCQCGIIYRPKFPENYLEIEEALSHRSPNHRHFFPDVLSAFKHNVILLDTDGKTLRGENIEDLLRENELYKEQTIAEKVAAYERRLRGDI